jgi:long-chain fatty acid transport protein
MAGLFLGALLCSTVLGSGPFPAFSGVSASADDARVAGTNPAAMTTFDESLQRVDLYGFHSDSTWEGRLGEDGPTRLTEDQSTTFVPQAAFVVPFRERWWFGFTVLGNGLSEDYEDDWIGRYYLQAYDLLTVSAFPSLATRLSERWSIAVSLPISYTQYDQRKAVPNLEPDLGDGSLVIETDAVAVGFGLSLLYEVSAQTRVGFNYRSAIEPSLSGTAEFSGLGPLTEQVLEEAGLLGARIDVTSRQPQGVTFGVYHDFNNGHALSADLAWAETSDFVLAEVFVNGDVIVENQQEYEDVIALSGSYSWPVADRWRVGLGGFWVSEMIDDANRTMTLRLDDMWSFGAGLEWRWKPGRTVNFTLNYLEIGDSPVQTPELPGIGSVTGRYTERGTLYLQAALSFGPTRS